MNILRKIVILLVCLALVSVKVQAQDVSINIINQPSTVTQGSTLGRVTVDICNNDGGSRSAAANRLRPLITLPSNLIGSTLVPITTTGWTVLTNDGQTIRLENTSPILPGECSQIVLGYTGVTIGGPSTVTGTLGFNGPQTIGNLTGNDNSTTSITVITGDTDGDGDPDVTDPQPTNPCSWGTGQVLANTSTAWRDADCDGDGVTNYKEATGTDNDPLTTADNTDPNDACSYNKVDQVLANVDPSWLTKDCDKDGNPNGTDPNPQTATAANDALTAPFGTISTVNVLSNDDFLPVASNVITRTGGTASGTVVFAPTTGIMSYTPSATEPGGVNVTVIYQVCNTLVTPQVCASATVTISVPLAGDQDGDGDPDNTDPQPTNPCVWGIGQVLANTSTVWRDADCDGDGVTNYAEATGADGNPTTIADNTNPLSACSLNLSQVTLVATSTGDCDGDGVTNKDEINGIDDNPLTTADNTDPNDACSYNKVDQVLANVDPSWLTKDCDKDGNPNGTDPNPQTATAANDALTAPFGTISTVNVLSNDDFLPVASNVITRTGGTASGTVVFAPTTGIMSYTPSATEPGGVNVTVIYQVCNTLVTPQVCASATVTISVPLAGDQDGDGDPDNTDPQPTNPCVWGIGQVLANTSTTWRTGDCDGDGVTNYAEATGADGNPATIADNTNPLSACSLNLSQVTLVATSTGDCDGDGVTNKDEINGIDDNPLTTADNTDPNDACSYNKVDQVLANVDPSWLTKDCDKDGNPNGTDPNPQTATAANDALTAPFGTISTVNVLSNDDFLPVASNVITRTGGTASGTVVFAPTTGIMSYTPSATEPGGVNVTVIYQVCNTLVTPQVCASATVTISVPLAGDQDGDGDPDNTDPQPTNPCVWGIGQVLANTSTVWRDADCDGDGVTNYAEATGADGNPATIADNTNPLSACSLNLSQVTLVATSTGDCDGDGVTNKDEINGIDDNPLTTTDNTDPNDACSYNKVDQVLANVDPSWLTKDCDKDGNPNGTDPNPQTATAANDALTAPFGTISTVNVLSNDDFLPVASNVITRTGGTASGTVVFAPTTGIMSYTPSATEPGGVNVTVIYQVCNTLVTPQVCASATVTISVPLAGDQDGDGDPDNTDPQPTNPCVWGIGQVLANTSTTWRTGDCDGDGVTNYAEATGADGNPATIADNTNPLSACSLNLSQVTLVATSTGDCDGDGVTNKDEINGIDDNPLTTADNTDPNDACSYNKVDQVLANVDPSWLTKDCDKDGNPNGTDPNPQTATAANDALTAPFGTISTVNVLSNDDFLPVASNVITRTGGTASGTVVFAPTTGIMSYTPSATEPGGVNVTVIYQVCNTLVTPQVCASATVTISVPLAGDQDGDGDPDNTDPQPTNPCVWGIGQVLANTSTTWRTGDCDGDGVTNYAEATGPDGNPATIADNTNPLSACSLNLGQVTLVATSTGDCDGDGVTNKDEINGIDDNPLTTADNTDPNDACSYNKVDQVLANVDPSWLTKDCDKDGNPNGTDPNPQTATAANDALTAPFGTISTVNVLSNDDFLPVASNVITRTGGTASGTVVFAPTTGIMSYTPSASEPGSSVTVIYQVCNTLVTPQVCASATVTISVPLAGDQDGDGDPDNTDPQPTNPCAWGIGQVLANTSTTWRTGDCDGDGVTNYAEATGADGNPATIADNTNPLSACSLNLSQVTLVATSTGDCDGDGVTNKDEINGIDDNPLTTSDNTDPNDGCSYNKVDQVFANTSVSWKALDCDKDGNPNGTDPNPKVATAANDALTAPFGTISTVNVLSNDDFLPVASNVITQTGGTASGTVVFAPSTGIMSYTPSASEPGSSVTVIYQVCNTAVTPNVCASATVTISVPLAGDQDGDGDPDNTDPQPTNPCVWGIGQVLANTSTTWRSADCDGDGVTNYAEATGADGNPATIADNTNPLSACSLNLSQVTLVATSTGDCDGDGVTNKDEINGIDDDPLTTSDNTDPNDGCSYNKVDQVFANTSVSWKALDCDKDGNPNGTDPNPQTATAANDALTAPFGTISTVNVLSNDDFLPVASNVITRTGGTASGTAVFAPVTGVLSYTPTVSEPGTTVTVIYQVCNTLVTPQVCANATVTITVPAAPRLSITKAAPSGSINAFDNFTYTITVSNLGSAATTGTITVKDTLQSGLSFVSSSTATGWSCSSSGQVVTCSRTSSIPSGSNSSFSLTVTALSNGVYQNKAGVYGGGDPVAINGTSAAQSNNTSVSVGQSVVKLTAKVFLRGAYDTSVGLMLDGLRSQGLIPLVQPYGKGSYTDIPHIGAEEATTTSVLSVTGSNAIVDWVSVELRDKNNPSTILYSRSGLVQRDGDIVDVDGVSCLSFVGAVPESYYVTVRHRNHLGAMTANAIALTSSCSALVDFTSPSLSLYKKATTDPEYTAYPTVDLGSVRALWGGNASPDRFVIYQGPNNDRTFIGSVVLTDAGNTEGLNNYMVTGYLRPDINLDGLVIFQGPGNDVNLLFNEIFTHPENVEKLNNFIIYQQLP